MQPRLGPMSPRSRHTQCFLVAVTVLQVWMLNAAAQEQQQQQQESASGQLSQHLTVPLPPGSRPEGVAKGAHNDLWVACLSGAILHVDLARNTSTLVHTERNTFLSGVKFCQKQQLLFVAGTLSGKGFVYHLRKQATPQGPKYSVVQREVLDMALPSQGYINDVTLTSDRAYFTNSFKPVLYHVPRFWHSESASAAKRQGRARPISKVHTGPFFDTKVGQFRANGIATYASKPHKDILLVANTHTGNVYKIIVPKLSTTSSKGAAVTASKGSPTKPPSGADRLAELLHAPQKLAAQLGASMSNAASRLRQALPATKPNSDGSGNAAAVSVASILSGAPAMAGASARAAMKQDSSSSSSSSSSSGTNGSGSAKSSSMIEVPSAPPQARGLLAAAAAAANGASVPVGWPPIVKSVADKVGLSFEWVDQPPVVHAEVHELLLPRIAGKATKHMLVDGLWVLGNSKLFVADNYNGRVWGLDISKGLEKAQVSCVWQGPWVRVPTTLAFQQGRLWWVDAHLDTCFPFLPCPMHKFELRGVAPASCQPYP